MWSLNYPPLPSQCLIQVYAVLILISLLITVTAIVLGKLHQPAKGAVLTTSLGTFCSQVPTANCWQGVHRDVHLPAALALLGSPALTRSGQFVLCAKWLQVGVVIVGGAGLMCDVCLKVDFQQLLEWCCQELRETVCILLKGIY